MASNGRGYPSLHNNISTSNSKMPAFDSRSKSDVSSMDDINFTESLDDLLETENLHETTASTAFYPMIAPSMQLSHSAAQSEPIQGLLAASGTVGTSGSSQAFGLPNIPYAVGTSPHSAQLPGMDSYLSNMQVSASSEGSMAFSSQYQQQMMSIPFADMSSENSVSSSCEPKKRKPKGTRIASRDSKRLRTDVSAVSEDESERHRRRQDRNLREQQRSQKITCQIDTLKDILAAANVQFKPDKYSTLVSVADYIRELQEKSAMLDMEQKKLVSTISKTNELVNDQYLPASTNGSDPPGFGVDVGGDGSLDSAEGFFVPNIDYKNIFASCGVPLAVLSIDGRFLECNRGFELVSGYSRDELLPREKQTLVGDGDLEQSEIASADDSNRSIAAQQQTITLTRNLSLFNILNRVCMEDVFVAMSEMLKHAPVAGDSLPLDNRGREYWTGDVYLSRNSDSKMRMYISLVRSSQGRAKFFNCTLTTPTEET